MTFNPLGIVALIIAFVIVYYGFIGGAFLNGGFLGSGPVATGPGTTEIRNPLPVNDRPAVQGSVGQAGSSNTGTTNGQVRRPGDSPYRGEVGIQSIRRGTLPENQEIVIRHTGSPYTVGSDRNYPIDVSGWKVEALRHSALIPQAVGIPEIETFAQDIILPAGGTLVVTVGSPAYGGNFRGNVCLGYIDRGQGTAFTFSNSCPRPQALRSEMLRQGLSGRCIDLIETTPSCQTPKPLQPYDVDNQCLDFIRQNFTYVGCVARNRDSRDFYLNTWRVSLRQPSLLFDPLHDRITLRDRSGLIVDEYEY